MLAILYNDTFVFNWKASTFPNSPNYLPLSLMFWTGHWTITYACYHFYPITKVSIETLRRTSWGRNICNPPSVLLLHVCKKLPQFWNWAHRIFLLIAELLKISVNFYSWHFHEDPHESCSYSLGPVQVSKCMIIGVPMLAITGKLVNHISFCNTKLVLNLDEATPYTLSYMQRQLYDR